jgi:hypothetical protein
MAIDPSGHVFYEDEYEQKYEVQWETIGGVIDITSITQQPYIWGEEPEGFVRNGILYRKGIVTVHRQALQVYEDGYIIIAEGTAQYHDFIQMNFPCEPGPSDPFAYHIDCFVLDEVPVKVLEGPHWADPSDPDDADTIWGDLNADGSPVADLTGTGGLDILEWVDVWSN